MCRKNRDSLYWQRLSNFSEQFQRKKIRWPWHHSDLNQIVQLPRFLFPLSSFWIVLEITMTIFMRTKCISVLECCKKIPVSKSQLQKSIEYLTVESALSSRLGNEHLKLPNSSFAINVSLICLYFLLGLHLIFRS